MDRKYITRERLISYHNQVRLIGNLGSQVKNILEIGIKNSLLREMIAGNGYNVTTGDSDPDLNPDLIIDLQSDFAIPQDKFDTIVLFQVLEHIPYNEFEIALKKLATATKKFLVISLPYYTSFLSVNFKLNTNSRRRHLLLQIPNFWKTKPMCKNHCWEIGIKGYPKKQIVQSLKNTGLQLKTEYQDPLQPYHYFFVLEKVKSE